MKTAEGGGLGVGFLEEVAWSTMGDNSHARTVRAKAL